MTQKERIHHSLMNPVLLNNFLMENSGISLSSYIYYWISKKFKNNKTKKITINFWSTVTWFWPQELRYLIIWLQGSHVIAEKAIILENIIIALKRALKILNSQPWRCCPFCFRPMQFLISRSFHLMLDAVRKTDSVWVLTFNIDNFVEWSRK